MATTFGGNSFAINGIWFPAKNVKINYESLATEDSGRTLDGVIHIYWIYNRIRKFEITLPPCEGTILTDLFSRVQGREYRITIWDPINYNWSTFNVYTSNSHVDCYSGVLRDTGLWEGATFNAIEIAGEKI